jgi:dienelactone hydrolase
MNTFINISIILFLSHFSFSQKKSIEIAETFFQNSFFQNSNLNLSYNLCSDELKQNLSFDQFSQTIISVSEKIGVAQEIKSINMTSDTTVSIYVQYSSFSFCWSIELTKTFKIKAFFISSKNFCEQNLEYYKDSVLIDKLVKIQSSEDTVDAYLTIPNDRINYDVVVLLSGSGPQNVNYTFGKSNYFQDLSRKLAVNGIGSIRIEKRNNFLNLDSITLFNEQIEDAIIAIKELEQNENIDSIILLGHSLGANSLVPVFKSSKKVKSLIIISGTLRSLDDVLLDQLNFLERKKFININDSLYAKAKYLKDSLSFNSPACKLPFNISSTYWIYLKQQNMTDEFSRLTIPVLILLGKNDYQLNKADYKTWRNIANQNNNLHLIYMKKHNHFLTYSKKMAVPSDYINNSQSISNMPFEAIIEFVKK